MTCGYFSVSAMRSCVRPASATTSPRMFGERLRREDRLHAACRARREYCVMPTAAANLTVRLRGKPEKSGSSMAPRISRTRSARKLKHSTPSPSLHAAIVADHRRHDELVELLLAHRRRRSTALRVGKARALGLDDRRRRPSRRAPSACRGPSRSSGRSTVATGTDVGSAAAKRCEVVAGRLRRRIAAVGEGMHHASARRRRRGSSPAPTA